MRIIENVCVIEWYNIWIWIYCSGGTIHDMIRFKTNFDVDKMPGIMSGREEN